MALTGKSELKILLQLGIVLPLLCVAGGCSAEAPVLAMSPNAPGASPLEVNLGVVLLDRESYYCLSAEQVGISTEDRIVSATSSCECIEPQILEYYSRKMPSGEFETKQAVLLKLAHENRPPDADFRPTLLGVQLKLEFADCSAQMITLNSLQTLPGG